MKSSEHAHMESESIETGINALGGYLMEKYGTADLAQRSDMELLMAFKVSYEEAKKDKFDELLDGAAPF